MRKILIILLLFWLFVNNSEATVVYTSISQDSLTLGERLELRVSLVTPRGARIVAPDPEQGIGKLVVKSWDSQRVQREKSDSLWYKYLLTVYTVEPCTIPRLPFVEIKPDRQDTVWSDSILIRVVSVIDAKPGDTVKLKDLKPQQKAGTPSFLWLWLLCAAAAIAGVVLAVRHYLKKRQQPPAPPPPKPPYEEALEAIRNLEAKQYLMKGMIREFVFEISRILKRYIGRRFDCNAEEFTTEEIVGWIQSAPVAAAQKRSLEWFFTETHPVKFAKMIPDNATVTQFLEETKAFIESTKPVEEKSQQPDVNPKQGGTA